MQPRDKLVMQILALSVAAFANVNTYNFIIVVYKNFIYKNLIYFISLS